MILPRLQNTFTLPTHIYPRICASPSDREWIDLIDICSKEVNNIFNISNFFVVLCKENIIGISCTVPCASRLTFLENIPISKSLSQNIAPVVKGYFEPLIEETASYTGYNIVNVCIDEKYRGKGIGKLLMSHCVDEYGAENIHLDVISSNNAAVALYKKFGFKIQNEYMGFSGDDTFLPCYHMIRE